MPPGHGRYVSRIQLIDRDRVDQDRHLAFPPLCLDGKGCETDLHPMGGESNMFGVNELGVVLPVVYQNDTIRGEMGALDCDLLAA